MFIYLMIGILVILAISLFCFIAIISIDSILITAPFISTRKKIIPYILESLKLTNNSVFFDLGCGNGYILRKSLESNPKITAIGVDIGILPIFIAKTLSFNLPITFKREDIFLTDISKATHIYLYTSTKIMSLIESKIYNECAKGTRIVSLDFKFENKIPVEHIPLSSKKYSLGKDLYIYIV